MTKDEVIKEVRERFDTMSHQEKIFWNKIAPQTKEFFKGYRSNIEEPYNALTAQLAFMDESQKVKEEQYKKELENWEQMKKDHYWADYSLVHITGDKIICAQLEQLTNYARQIDLQENFYRTIKNFLGRFGMLSSELQVISDKSESAIIAIKKNFVGTIDKFLKLKQEPLEEIKKNFEKNEIYHIHPHELKYLDYIPYRPFAEQSRRKFRDLDFMDGAIIEELRKTNEQMKKMELELMEESVTDMAKRLVEFTKLADDASWRRRLTLELWIYYTKKADQKREIIMKIFTHLKDEFSNINTMDNITKSAEVILLEVIKNGTKK